MNEQEKENLRIKKMVYASIFVAMTVVIHTLRIVTPTPLGSISYKGFPIIFSGITLGPVWGFATGAVGDIVAFLVRPSGNAFNPLFTLTAGLTGAIPALVLKLLNDKKRFNIVKIFFAISIGQLITTVFLAPLFVTILYSPEAGFWVRVGKAFIKQIVNVPLYTFVLSILAKRVYKHMNI